MQRIRSGAVLATVVVGMVLSAVMPAQARASSHMVRAGHTARWTVTSPWWMTVIPCFYVNGNPLLSYELDNHGLVATFYGDGTVARIRQAAPRSNLDYVSVATVNPRERVTLVLIQRANANC